VMLRNHHDTTNYSTFFNQVKKIFQQQKNPPYVAWWHDLKTTNRDRRTFRLVLLSRPPVSEEYLDNYIKRPGAVWNDFVGVYSVKSEDKLSMVHDTQTFQQTSNNLSYHAVALLVNHFSDSDDYNVKSTAIDVVPFCKFDMLREHNSIGCTFNANYEANKEKVRVFLIETRPHPTIVPYLGSYEEYLPISFDTGAELHRELATLQTGQITVLPTPNIHLLTV
jgi:hypothetical protein